MTVPASRIRRLNEASYAEEAEFVLYWMIAHRRPTYNFALQRARDLALKFDRPLLILEALRHGYQWASDRLHTFILEGMAANGRAFADLPVHYYPFLETPDHCGKGLLKALANSAVAVVTDDFPAFFLPRMIDAAAEKISVPLEAVDSNGLLPMRGTDRLYKRAYHFRRYVHDVFLEGDLHWPEAEPIADSTSLADALSLPDEVLQRWPPANSDWLEADPDLLARLPIDHEIPPNPELPGGVEAARAKLTYFLDHHLAQYHERQKELTESGESGLSPYLHFGHISPHRIFDAIRDREDWTIDAVDAERRAKNEGFWGTSDGAESYLDELITWRELGFNRCALDPTGYADYDTLPDWAIETLADHADDPRPHIYDLHQFEAARTHDELWNAAQHQLVTEGTMHGYLRMLWGKKILHWSQSPQQALAIMIELNNKYALDGRDPNSYNGIFWILGRFDRAWGPEREVFGKVRYMTSDSTRRKFKVHNYLEQYGTQ